MGDKSDGLISLAAAYLLLQPGPLLVLGRQAGVEQLGVEGAEIQG